MCVCVWSPVLEDEKLGLQKDAGDLHSNLLEVETARLDAERHSQELQRNLKSVESERNLLTASVNDLHMTLTQADDKLDQLRQDNFALKQKVVS